MVISNEQQISGLVFYWEGESRANPNLKVRYEFSFVEESKG
jgi:hypothetical protein